jgi:hypothetical protein
MSEKAQTGRIFFARLAWLSQPNCRQRGMASVSFGSVEAWGSIWEKASTGDAGEKSVDSTCNLPAD